MAEALEQDHRCSESKFAASFVPLELRRGCRDDNMRVGEAPGDCITGQLRLLLSPLKLRTI